MTAADRQRLIGGQAVRFLLVGTSNFLIGFTTFRLVLMLPVEFTFKVGTAQLCSYGVGTVWSFFCNRRFTFKSREAVGGQLTRFVLLQATLAASSSVIIDALVAVRPESPSLIWVLVMGVVTVVNFTVCRTWVYRNRKDGAHV